MALYAEKDADGKVLRVVVCDDPAWLAERLGGNWVETTTDHPTERYAGPGMYESDIPPQRFVREWVQPTHAENAYPTGAWVWHAGQVWENLTAANVWEPGVSGWRDPINEWPAWIQPTGAHDAYPLNAKVSHNGKHWINTGSNANVWEPGVFGWTVQA